MAVLQDLVHLFYPTLCEGCSQALIECEKQVCISCLSKLSLTGYDRVADNKVARLFWGRVNIQKATSVYFFEKDSRLQHLIHALKYSGNHRLGLFLGQQMGIQLNKGQWLKDIDLLIPVPLHPKKQKQRGYNQAEMLARGMAGTSIPWEIRALRRNRNSKSQTNKSRIERWDNMSSIMAPGAAIKSVQGQQVLLVDDIITTGATLEACAHVLLEQGAKAVSVCTLACTFT